MKKTAESALEGELTAKEKRLIERILDRLSRVDGKALHVLQRGCSDWQEGAERFGSYNLWKD